MEPTQVAPANEAKRVSGEVRRIVRERRQRMSPKFSFARWSAVLLSSDSGFAEILVGVWLVGLRGLLLIDVGFTYGAVGQLMGSLGVTAGHIGVLLIVFGLGQTVAAGTGYFRLRAALAFNAALVCLSVWLAYVGSDLGHTALAWTWAGLAICESCLSWRILLSRLVSLDQLTGPRR